ncbi:hypothetical protein Lfu02_08950 [Longispora fulva]|uniref:ATP-grasp domain-containing protein n=1 Tax=Longispora fulva TaxID=619741 RepID=A0A8J7KEP9_9ACTN|nr:hypothetical protein [Longispora fulva]MBG6135240.1 hypothetical protein [Longispora fulva]GIG56523.1 hypothetical protein Lfu02_08950 [Longispora fulva]
MPTARHRHTRDALSARPLAVADDTAVLCSAGGTDPELLAVMRDGGLPVGTDLREFRTEAEFAARVAEAMADGLLISMEYPQPTDLCPDARTVKTALLVGYLNNKASISTLVDPRFQARRSVVTRAELADAAPAEKSWVLKAATNAAHGGSLDVYLHEAGSPISLPVFATVLDEFVIEEYLRIKRNWGIQLHIGPDARARLLAVTEQRIDDAGIYAGGRFGLVNAPPFELLTECLAIAQRAADVGYRGLCSLDCAQSEDGQLVVLDLNFRITSGSIPLLALRSIRPHALDLPAESAKLSGTGPLGDLLTALRPAVRAGGLLVIAGHDSLRTDAPVAECTLQILVYGDDPDEVTARRAALEHQFGH